MFHPEQGLEAAAECSGKQGKQGHLPVSGHTLTNPCKGVGLATPHAECRAEEPGLPMPCIETIKTYLLPAAFLLHDAQDACSNVTSKYSRQTVLGCLHGFHAMPWGRPRGAWARLWVRDGVRAHMFSPSTTNLQWDAPHTAWNTSQAAAREEAGCLQSKVKPATSPVDGGKHLLLLILHEPMAFSPLQGKWAAIQTQER